MKPENGRAEVNLEIRNSGRREGLEMKGRSWKNLASTLISAVRKAPASHLFLIS
jgi:hypothetical protein